MDTAEISLDTDRRSQLVAITDRISSVIRENRWQNGLLTVFSPHTTAGVTINENADPDVARDMESFMAELVPSSTRFRHCEGNSDSHIKATLTGSSAMIIVKDGKPWLGTWQGIYLCEFDGPRRRQVRLAFLMG